MQVKKIANIFLLISYTCILQILNSWPFHHLVFIREGGVISFELGNNIHFKSIIYYSLKKYKYIKAYCNLLISHPCQLDLLLDSMPPNSVSKSMVKAHRITLQILKKFITRKKINNFGRHIRHATFNKEKFTNWYLGNMQQLMHGHYK